MAILKNTTVTDTGNLQLTAGTTFARPNLINTIIQWTNTGTQAYTVLAGTTPTLTNSSWTCPTGVNQIELLTVAGGGSGGGSAGGGGGAGGLIYNSAYAVTPGQVYNITVGAGATIPINNSGTNNGSNTVFGNLVVNGNFDADTNWAKQNASVTISGGVVTCTAGSADVTSDYFTITSGRTYTVSWTCTAFTNGSNRVLIRKSDSGVVTGGQVTTARTAVGTYSYTFTATETTSAAARVEFPSTGTSSVDNVIVVDVTTSQLSIGGGGGSAMGAPSSAVGNTGGSGGGGNRAVVSGATDVIGTAGGAGTVGQGFPGGYGRGYDGNNTRGGGGGGAGGPGSSAPPANGGVFGGSGGIGLAFNISGTMTYYAGGGGGGCATNYSTAGTGGLGGGGQGGAGSASGTCNGYAGTANTGGGGGGGAAGGGIGGIGGAGGSGIVIIKYSVISDNTAPVGITRYNSDIRGLEVYEGTAKGWVTQDPTRNFGGHNLLTHSDNFDPATSTWTVAIDTLIVNATRAPDGTQTADLHIAAASASVIHRLRNAGPSGLTSGDYYTLSAYVKAAGYSWVKLRQGSNATNFNLSTGTIGSSWNGYGTTPTPAMTNVGNGWYRLSVTAQCNATTDPSFIYIDSGDSATADTVSWTGDGSSGVYVWGFQLEKAISAGPYVRTFGAISPVPTSLNGYRTHTYTTVGTSGFTPAVTGLVEVLVVAGGGGGAQDIGGGGGGGGVIYTTTCGVLANQPYKVVVGYGGTAGQYPAGIAATQGGDSQFATLVAIGGGCGGLQTVGRSGGSSGGASGSGAGGGYVVGQGFSGGNGQGSYAGAGGGGAGGAGANGIVSVSGGNGGVGFRCDISGVPTWYAGGGGASTYNVAGTTIGTGGWGGGGRGGDNATNPAVPAGTSGTANTGGGGGGAGVNSNGGAGGSGIVIVRYRYD
jgi:hypothetical protein